jgi:hypothetical protein
MISVGTIGAPAIGALQDRAFTEEVRAADPALAQSVLTERPGIFGHSFALDPAKRSALANAASAAPADATLQRQVQLVTELDSRTKQGTLGTIAILPGIMLLCYLGLIAYFRARGGYKALHLTTEGSGAGGGGT